MFSIMLKGLICFLTAYIFINLFPIPSPFTVEDFLVECILNPMGFLTAMICFLIGFLCLGALVQEIVFIFKKQGNKSKRIGTLMVPILWICSLLLLLQVGFWHMLIFYGFGIFYGMMSLKEKLVNGG